MCDLPNEPLEQQFTDEEFRGCMGFRRGSCAEYLLWHGRVGLGATYTKSGAPRACGVIELSEMFEGGLGERGTLAGDAQDESGALVVS